MQLDKTRIAVRERGAIDTFDLTFHVMRAFSPQLLTALLIGILPFAVLDYFLVGWMDERLDFETEGPPIRYLWHYTLLVFFQAPAATIFGVDYLGSAMFRHEKKLRHVVRDVVQVFPGFFLTQLLMRGTLLASLIPLAVWHDEVSAAFDVMVPFGLLIYVGFVRSIRPYINEIVVLERNPLRSPGDKVLTVGRRSGLLHGPSGADLMALWLGSVLVGTLIASCVYLSLFWLRLVMVGDYNPLSPFSLHIMFPVALWSAAAFLGVARFLSYLDLRIRQEGWEVELLLKAEGNRLQEKLA